MTYLPREHQAREFERTKDLPNWCLWWDQGTGKSKVVIMTADHLFAQGKIDAVLIIAPGGVESNWVYDEIPKHSSTQNRLMMVWNTPKRHTKAHKDQFQELMEYDGLKVLAVSYSTIMTDDGAKAIRRFLDSFKVLYVCDEASAPGAIKNPNTKTTKRVIASSKYAKYRRLLSGTPVDDCPFQAYSQIRWADPNVWANIGITNFAQFKVFFGEWEKRRRSDGQQFPQLIRYQNLDILNKKMYEIGSRVLKTDVLDLPDKVYTQVYFEMSDRQWKLYRDLRDQFYVELTSGSELTAELPISRILRFQQITSGYLPTDDDEQLRSIWTDKDTNPRLKALAGALETTTGPTIIWAKYNIDIDAIVSLLKKRKLSYCIYDGRTSAEDRQRFKTEFQDGRYRVFLAKPSVAGRGITLTAATDVIYYNNSFSLEDRRQSEDRAHRIGLKHSVRYIDIIARGTVDEHILNVLRGKRDTAAVVTGDTLNSWV
jgi:SNF2 family DNA or RNA helicase